MSATSDRQSLLPPLWVLTLLSAGLAFWLAFRLKEILVLVVVGYCISYAIEPAVSWLNKKGISRKWAVGMVALTAVILLLILALIALPPLVREATELAENFPNYVETVKEKLKPLLGTIIEDESSPLYEVAHSPLNALQGIGKDILPKVTAGASSVLLKGYSVTLTIVNLALLPFIVFYLSSDFPAIGRGFVQLFPPDKREKVKAILREIDGYTSAFVRGQIVVCSVLFVLFATGLGLLGLELWFVVAFVAGFGNLIPYVGSLIGIILASIMAIVTFGDFSHVLMVWGIFAAVQFVEGSVITPKIIGNSVGLSPLAVILAIVAGGSLFGLLGIFLAVPGAAVIKVLARHTYSWVLSYS